ncbi:hypothetical protein [Couchioplanes caeruleus]|uniref:Uncharacterized protein n=2 Tax=Couchioplanes caeruleus TaxID=56438 RepID=A0A1K0GAQ9_9ACTN|nr:hypothetical protein [Couchioplanes caeruleus]OJF14330.1 hypothetical protein BG844_10405 [Couchioplanes caeruleus subsp. caeruleus]ROP32876.1 hypothetical protein EDD30_5829 [Couchioplanes caeruleus]
MAAPGHDALLISLLAACTACIGYAVGRLHQWYRTGLDRDEAYRDGYETATRSVFSTAARLIGPRREARGTAAVRSATVAPAAPADGGRHLVPDELVQAATYRLAPDRVARAKVPGAASAAADDEAADAASGDDGQETTRLRSVPRPRSS